MSSLSDTRQSKMRIELGSQCRAAFQDYLLSAKTDDKHELDPFALFCAGFELGVKLATPAKKPVKRKKP